MPNYATPMNPSAFMKCMDSGLDRDALGLSCGLTALAGYPYSSLCICLSWPCDLLDELHLLAKWSISCMYCKFCLYLGIELVCVLVNSTYMILGSYHFLCHWLLDFCEGLLHEWLLLLTFSFCFYISLKAFSTSKCCMLLCTYPVCCHYPSTFCILPSVCHPIQLGSGYLWCEFLFPPTSSPCVFHIFPPLHTCRDVFGTLHGTNLKKSERQGYV